jgi:hypothetical protein
MSTGWALRAIIALAMLGACAPASTALTLSAHSVGCVIGPREPAAPGCPRVGALDGTVVASPDGRDVYIGSFFDVRLTLLRRDPSTGALHPRSGRDGCIGNPDHYAPHLRCRSPGHRVDGTVDALAISPDGKSVYLSQSGALIVLRRNPRTGLLHPLRGRGGCLGDARLGGCSQPLHGVAALAVSSDGRSLYAGGQETIDVVAVNRRTGALRRIAGPGGCFAEDPQQSGERGCTAARGIGALSAVAVAPDGRDVYVAGSGSNGIGAFRRARNGSLSQSARYPCLTENGGDQYSFDGTPGACQDGKALQGASGLAFSPDGRRIYVSGEATSTSDSGQVSVIERNPATGAITQGGCLTSDGSDSQDPDHGTCTALGLIGDVSVRGIAVAAGGRALLIGESKSYETPFVTRSALLALPLVGGEPWSTGVACASDGTPPPCTVVRGIGDQFAVEAGGGGQQVLVLRDGFLQPLDIRP